MRSCIYCGKGLEKGERCNCPSAVARREANDNTNKQQSSYSYSAKNNTYHTGYTKKENPIKSAWQRYSQRKKAARTHDGTATKPHRRNLFFDIFSFIKSPVTTIYNPGEMSIAFILLIAGLTGAVTGLVMYALFMRVINGAASITTGSFNMSMVVSGVNGIFGAAILVVLSAIIGIALFFAYCGAMYFISRCIFKYNFGFWYFATKLSLCPIPIAISGIIAVVFGIISRSVFGLVIFCGIIAWIILTYESLRTIWSSKTPNQVLYGMLLGVLIMGIILTNLIWII